MSSIIFDLRPEAGITGIFTSRPFNGSPNKCLTIPTASDNFNYITDMHNSQIHPYKEDIMKKVVLALLLLVVMTTPVMAKTVFDLNNFQGLPDAQDQFKKFSTDFGLAISYVPLAPAEPLGGVLPGFDAGVEVTMVKIDKNASYWQAAGTDIPATLPIPKLHIQVGLPVIPIDLGYSYASVPGTDIKLSGYEIKYAILKGGIVMPALAIRGAMTTLKGIDVLDLSTKSLDLSISKGFLIFTPYAGIGKVWIDSKPKDTGAPILKDVSVSETKSFLGLKMSLLPILNIVAEADFAKVKEYSFRLNLHF